MAAPGRATLPARRSVNLTPIGTSMSTLPPTCVGLEPWMSSGCLILPKEVRGSKSGRPDKRGRFDLTLSLDEPLGVTGSNSEHVLYRVK